MANNNLSLLNSIIDQYHSSIDQSLNKDAIFEKFVAEMFFKKYDLTAEDIDEGLVGGKNDWGIDGIYILVNDRNIIDLEDIDLNLLNKGFTIQLFIFQFKNKNSFEESVINKFQTGYNYIVDLDKTLPSNKVISQDVLDKIDLFRNIVQKAAFKYPNVIINYIHASKGETSSILSSTPRIPAYVEKMNNLKSNIEQYNLGSSIECNYILLGAEEIKNLNQYEKTYSGSLKQKENPIYVEYGDDDNKQKGYIACVSLKDYFDFLVETDTEDESKYILKEHLFEANIRDYQNHTEVNKAIEETLRKENRGQDFWWLNNGITILADEGSLTGKTFVLENIQIVNGLQTSYSIYKAFKDSVDKLKEDNSTIFCKIIITEEEESRDAIIKATNSQNTVSPSLLRSTDGIQRDIEHYFLNHDLYYDRRKNYYRNKNKDTKKIISINYLAQALTAILFDNPSKARTSPTVLTKKDEDYEMLFNNKINIEVYYFVVLIRRKMEEYLKDTFNTKDAIEESIKKYFKLHLTKILSSLIIGKTNIQTKDISGLSESIINDIEELQFKKSISILKEVIEENPEEINNLANFSKRESLSKAINKKVESKLTDNQQAE